VGMELFEAIHSQRAIRRFNDEPVPDELVRKILDAAIRAPSGGNRQPWSFIVVTDTTVKLELGRLYKESWDQGGVSKMTSHADFSIARVYTSAQYLADRMGEAPVLVLACIETGGGDTSITTGSSIYPAVQNLMLAARGLGLGTVITTIHKGREAEVKTLLGIPANVETAALIPMGFPGEGARFGPTKRVPVDEVAHRDRWGGAL
jgi:nitroreductase